MELSEDYNQSISPQRILALTKIKSNMKNQLQLTYQVNVHRMCDVVAKYLKNE